MQLPSSLTLVVLLAILALVPFLIVMVTSFAKIIIVFFIVRNALGIQQIPPNLVLYGLTIILTSYITLPLMSQIYDAINEPRIAFEDVDDWVEAADRAKEPFREYLLKYTEPAERTFFLDAAQRLWPEQLRETATSRDLAILIPAFTVSELRRAFEIGVLLYLPFIAIDIVVSNILLAMGMMMVSPLTISLPFKILLFVVADGWTRLIHGLVLSYE